jgi:hypothetical protein
MLSYDVAALNEVFTRSTAFSALQIGARVAADCCDLLVQQAVGPAKPCINPAHAHASANPLTPSSRLTSDECPLNSGLRIATAGRARDGTAADDSCATATGEHQPVGFVVLTASCHSRQQIDGSRVLGPSSARHGDTCSAHDFFPQQCAAAGAFPSTHRLCSSWHAGWCTRATFLYGAGTNTAAAWSTEYGCAVSAFFRTVSQLFAGIAHWCSS